MPEMTQAEADQIKAKLAPRVLVPVAISPTLRLATDVIRIPLKTEQRSTMKPITNDAAARAAKSQVVGMFNISPKEFDAALMSRTSIGPASEVDDADDDPNIRAVGKRDDSDDDADFDAVCNGVIRAKEFLGAGNSTDFVAELQSLGLKISALVNRLGGDQGTAHNRMLRFGDR
jgi:hypothetical protein